MNLPLLLPVICLVLCAGFFFYFRAFIKRNTSPGRILAEYRDEVHRLIAEIDAATDRDARLVEERITTLKALLEDTDRRISVYVRELERSRSGEALYTSLGRGIRAALSAPQAAPPAASPGQESALRQPDSASAAALPGLTAPVSPPAAQPDLALFPREDEAPPPSASLRGAGRSGKKQPADASAKAPDIRSQIAALAESGLPAEEIASRLGLSLSEIDLALNLLNRKG